MVAERRNIFGRVFPPAPAVVRPDGAVTSPGQRQEPGGSLVASAARITGKTISDSAFRKNAKEEWQEDAWAMYDLVGEQRFLSTTIANRGAQARLYVGKRSQKQGEDPVPVEDEKINGILDAIGDGAVGLAQLLQRMLVNLFITGDGWLVGIPKDLMPGTPEKEKADEEARSGVPQVRIDRNPRLTGGDGPDTSLPTLDAMVWKMLSVSEIEFKSNSEVKLTLGPSSEDEISVSADDVYLIRVWRPHPRHHWQADSPTRSSLPVLRELVGLGMHISAQVDSRLAGAGLLVVASGASRAMKLAAGLTEDAEEDPFTEALMQAMLTPIGDRANASALVPLVVTVPDELVKNGFEYMTFSKPLDNEARTLRDEAIRRLALGQDAPPELLLGSGGMNHWGAWLVREDVVSAHLEPPLALVCDALTSQYLRPVLTENGYTEEQAEEYVVWYDVSHMIIQPNRPADAKELYAAGVIGAPALRDATGFDETDAAPVDTTDPAIVAAFEMVKVNPGLMKRPGLRVIVDQLQSLLAGRPMGPIDGASDEQASTELPSDGVAGAGESPPPGMPVGQVPGTVGTPAGEVVSQATPASGAARVPQAVGNRVLPATAGQGGQPPMSAIPHHQLDGIRGTLSRQLAGVGDE